MTRAAREGQPPRLVSGQGPSGWGRVSTTTKGLLAIARATYVAWRQDRTHRLGAGLAFYALFTIVPLLALTAALAEWLFGAADVQQYFADRLQQLGLLDAEAASAAVTSRLMSSNIQSTLGIIGLTSLLFASSLFFLALTDAVKVIWKVPVESGLLMSLRRRLVAFSMVLVTGAVLIVGLAVSAVAGAAEALLPDGTDFFGWVADAVATVASFLPLTASLALLFRFLTPAPVSWRQAALAALTTAGLLLIGTVGISWYLRNFGGRSVAGAFGAVLGALTWIYYEAQILLGGVQLVKVLVSQPRAERP